MAILLLTADGPVDYHKPKRNWTAWRPHRGFLPRLAGGGSQGEDSFKAAVSKNQWNRPNVRELCVCLSKHPP